MRIAKALQEKPIGEWLLPMEARVAWHAERATVCRAHLEDIERNETLFVTGVEPHANNVKHKDAQAGTLSRFTLARHLRDAFETLTKSETALLPAAVRPLTESEKDQNARSLAKWRAILSKTADHHDRQAQRLALQTEARNAHAYAEPSFKI